MSDDETALAVRRTRSRHPSKLMWAIIPCIKGDITRLTELVPNP